MHAEMTGSEWKWRIWSSIPLHYAADGAQAKPGQASPRRRRENEWKRGEGWVEERVGVGQGCCFYLFNLWRYMCFLLFAGPSGLPITATGTIIMVNLHWYGRVGSEHDEDLWAHLSSMLLMVWCSILILIPVLSSAFLLHPPILASWGSTWAQPRRLRPQLTHHHKK